MKNFLIDEIHQIHNTNPSGPDIEKHQRKSNPPDKGNTLARPFNMAIMFPGAAVGIGIQIRKNQFTIHRLQRIIGKTCISSSSTSCNNDSDMTQTKPSDTNNGHNIHQLPLGFSFAFIFFTTSFPIWKASSQGTPSIQDFAAMFSINRIWALSLYLSMSFRFLGGLMSLCRGHVCEYRKNISKEWEHSNQRKIIQ